MAVLAGMATLAHGVSGEMTVLVAEAGEGLVVEVEVGVLYADDGHFAEDAEVMATLTGPDGATLGPVLLAHISGARYGTAIEVPTSGTWRIEIVSSEPEAVAEATVEVAPPETVTTTATTTTPTTTLAPTSTDPPGTAVDTSGPVPGEASPLSAIAVASAVIAIAAAAILVRRRRP